nr:hypothetical protein [Streptomyces purpureus]
MSMNDLPEELRELGRRMKVPEVSGESMAERVLAQILADALPVPVAEPPGRWERLRRWARRRWRALTVTVSGALVVLVLTPPVRATVADWFGFGGVEVRYDPSAPPVPGAAVPGCENRVPLREAAALAGFEPRIPAALGEPDAVSVDRSAPGRSVVGLCWTEGGRTIRLDQFPAELDPGFVKTVRVQPQWVRLSDGGTGYWFAEPHRLVIPMTDARGEVWTRTERPAGPTLLWTGPGGAGPTLRLEGEQSLERARRIAESVR